MRFSLTPGVGSPIGGRVVAGVSSPSVACSTADTSADSAAGVGCSDGNDDRSLLLPGSTMMTSELVLSETSVDKDEADVEGLVVDGSGGLKGLLPGGAIFAGLVTINK